MKVVTSLESAAARAADVSTLTLAGSVGRICRISSAGEVPSAAVTEIESYPCLSNNCCATGRSKTAIVAPPSDSTSPNEATPVIV